MVNRVVKGKYQKVIFFNSFFIRIIVVLLKKTLPFSELRGKSRKKIKIKISEKQ